MNLGLGGREFKAEMVVVSPLTSEAILGIQGQQAVIDLGCRRLHLKESGCELVLDAPPQALSCAQPQQARSAETVEVPPRCVLEVSAYLETAVTGVWLVEETVSGTSQLAVARAVVQPTSTTIPVCILNTSDEPATLYAGAVIAVLEPVEPPLEVDAVSDIHPEVSDDKQDMLWQLVQDCGAELSAGERDIFYDLLLTYSDVMASSTADLGRTDRLRHHIDTGNSPPVRQPVRRISPHRREEVKELLNQMLERGVVEPSSSPWASPMVLRTAPQGFVLTTES